jgi:mRNA interferase MazF
MKKGDICIINLAVEVDHEQYGQRPAIVISDTGIGTGIGILIVVPLTSNLEALRFPYTLAILPNKQNNLKQKSVALIFHIRAIDKSRVVKIIGKINKQIEEKINFILKEMLGL